MDYGDLLGAAWRVCWRHKYLWLLGLFAGGAMQFPFPGGAPEQMVEYRFTANEAERFISDHGALLLGLVALAGALLLALMVVSVVATAGLIAGTDHAYRGTPLRARQAWRQGLRCFWRLVGLWLVVLVGAMLAVGLLVGVVILALVLAYSGDGPGPGVALIVLAGLTGLLVFALVVAAMIVVSIVVNWAERALVLESTGVFASLGRGWRLFRSRPGASLLVWLLAGAVGLAVGLVFGGAVLTAAVPLVLVGMGAGREGNAFLWALLPLVVLVAALAFGFIKAVSQTYFSAYWTIAYRTLTATSPGPSPVEA